MFVRIMFLVLSIMMVSGVQAINFVEDKHYQIIEGELSKTKLVTEYFSFYCPHCFRQEPLMQTMLAQLPEGTTFVKNHVDSMPGRDREIEHALSKALIVAKILRVEDKMVPIIFNYIHVDKASFNSPNDIRNLFIVNDVDAQSYDKTMNSFSVNMQFNNMQKQTAVLRQQGIGTVPTVIVNGKYRVLTKNLKGQDDFLALVRFLLAKIN